MSTFADPGHKRLEQIKQKLASAKSLEDATRSILLTPISSNDMLKCHYARDRARRRGVTGPEKVQKRKVGIPGGEDIVRSLLLGSFPEDDVVLLTSHVKRRDPVPGRGGFKKVKYGLTMDTAEKRAVAICSRKAIESRGRDWGDALRDVLHEVKFLEMFSKIDQVVKLHFWIQTAEKVQLVLEWCDKDLGNHIKSIRDIEADRVNTTPQQLADIRQQDKGIIGDILAGVKAIHERGVIHRDLKPGNILVKDGRAKITDFGLSCLEIDDAACSNWAGTRAYFSPELLTAVNEPDPRKQEKEVLKVTTPRLDAWAAGLTIYQLLDRAERPPKLPTYDQKGIDKQIKVNIRDEFRPLLEKLLKVKPKDRADLAKAESKLTNPTASGFKFFNKLFK